MGTPIIVHPPEVAAERLGGISVRTLVKLLREGGYSYTELSPGAKPWGRGRRTWGLTDRQIETIIVGQARCIPQPEPSVQKSHMPGWNGIRRLKMRKSAL